MSAPTAAGARDAEAPPFTAPRGAMRVGPGGGRTGVRLAAALLAGIAVGLSWQPYGLWPLLLVGLPALTLCARGTRVRPGFAVGYVFGLGMLAVAVSWLHVLGVWVAALLILFEALFFGVLALALRLVTRLRFWPPVAAACWVGIEWAYGSVPFGGFGWTRLGYAAVDTPLAGLFPVVGVVGVSFAVALAGQLLAWAVVVARSGGPPRAGRLLVALVGLAALVAAGGALRGFQVEPATTAAGTLQVGIVQGNIPGRGIEAMGRARSVTNNHLAETIALMTQARLGEVAVPDFLLWPENSTDIDPTRDALTQLTVQAAVDVAERPILVGAVMEGPGLDERQTSALWWDPVAGVQARYDKQNLVPFGEWIPFRDRLLPLVPILAQVGAQSVPGTRPGVLDVAVAGRRVLLGDVICFELAYDDTVYSTITGGAQISLVQSNNATYGGTGQVAQQFAITRARAMETRREFAVATTNSLSGLVDRDGRVVRRTEEFTAAGMVVPMPLRSAVTPAVRVAPWLQRGLGVAALVGCLAGVAVRRRDRRAGFVDDQGGADRDGPAGQRGASAPEPREGSAR